LSRSKQEAERTAKSGTNWLVIESCYDTAQDRVVLEAELKGRIDVDFTQRMVFHHQAGSASGGMR